MPSPPICGGTSAITDLDHPDHEERLQAALSTIDGHAGRPYKVHRATKQAVAGMNYGYFITFNDDESQQMYKVSVWERLWLMDKDPAEARKVTFNPHNGDSDKQLV